jgi:hypothetical protein
MPKTKKKPTYDTFKVMRDYKLADGRKVYVSGKGRISINGDVKTTVYYRDDGFAQSLPFDEFVALLK